MSDKKKTLRTVEGRVISLTPKEFQILALMADNPGKVFTREDLIENIWGKRRIMEVYLNIAETGIGTYGVEAGAQRYFKHGASRLTPAEAARIAAILPLPKKREAISPSGFTRRYGNSIRARIGVVGRDGLDACIYK